MQHIFSEHSLVTRNNIGNGVVANVPHVQLAAGVGEHSETVEFLASIVWVNSESIALRPLGLKCLLKRLRLVFLTHLTVDPSVRYSPSGPDLSIVTTRSRPVAAADGSVAVLGPVPAQHETDQSEYPHRQTAGNGEGRLTRSGLDIA